MYKYKNFYALVLMAFVALGMQACETLGYDGVDIDTTRKAIVVSTAEVRGANLLLQDLINRRAISQSDAQEVKDTLQESKDTLQDALRAIDVSGDPFAAESGLERAKVGIRIAIGILAPIAEANPE